MGGCHSNDSKFKNKSKRFYHAPFYNAYNTTIWKWKFLKPGNHSGLLANLQSDKFFSQSSSFFCSLISVQSQLKSVRIFAIFSGFLGGKKESCQDFLDVYACKFFGRFMVVRIFENGYYVHSKIDEILYGKKNPPKKTWSLRNGNTLIQTQISILVSSPSIT